MDHIMPIFNIFVDFECNVKGVRRSERSDNTSYTETYQNHIPCSFSYKAVCVDDKFSKPVVLYRGKNAVCRSIKAILKEYDYCRGGDEKIENIVTRI